MFAEFEKLAHELVEAGGSLTAETLNKEYDKLNTMYYGSAIEHDDLIQYEWSRIPHFYRAYISMQQAILQQTLSQTESSTAEKQSAMII